MIAVYMAVPPVDCADVGGFFVLLVAAVIALVVVGYAWTALRADADEDDEIVERRRLNLIVRWPK